MLLKKYRVQLLASDLLQDLNITEWHKDITANSLESAWRKFKVQKMAPIYRFSVPPTSIESDYDVSLYQTVSI